MTRYTASKSTNPGREETMPALNRVQLIGYLGKDPESKFTPTGKKGGSLS
jgi:hypothetical protein